MKGDLRPRSLEVRGHEKEPAKEKEEAQSMGREEDWQCDPKEAKWRNCFKEDLRFAVSTDSSIAKVLMIRKL